MDDTKNTGGYSSAGVSERIARIMGAVLWFLGTGFLVGFPLFCFSGGFRKGIYAIILCWMPVFVRWLSVWRILPVRGRFGLILISCLTLYLAIVALARLEGHFLREEVAGYELAHVKTPASEAAEKALYNDTGRTLAPITGIVYSLLYNVIYWLGHSLCVAPRHRRPTADDSRIPVM